MILIKLKKSIISNNLFNINDILIVGVSGGSDSVGLLYLLNELYDYKFKIIVAHINHQLRDVESDRDEKFVHEIAKNLDFTFESTKVDTLSYKNKYKLSLEDAARELRYDFFERLFNKYKASSIVTAHTLNDQAETVLIRLLRGSGTLGLSGISLKSGKYVRPLLNITKSEISEYLESKNISWREDSTNLYNDFLRNKIRNELIPSLKEYNPKIEETFSRSALISGFDYDFINSKVKQRFNNIIKKLSIGDFGAVEKILDEPTAIRFGIIRRCIEHVKGDLKSLSSKHLFSIEEVLTSNEASGEVDLPDGLVFYKGHGLFFIGKAENVDSEYTLTINEIGSWKYHDDLTVEVDLTYDRTEFGDKNVAYLSANKVGFPIVVSSYQEGDNLIPLGMRGFKKVKDLYMDEKVPRFIRKKIPVFKSRDEIIWLGGMRVDERFKSNENDEMFLKIKISGFIDEFDSLIVLQKKLLK